MKFVSFLLNTPQKNFFWLKWIADNEQRDLLYFVSFLLEFQRNFFYFCFFWYFFLISDSNETPRKWIKIWEKFKSCKIVLIHKSFAEEIFKRKILIDRYLIKEFRWHTCDLFNGFLDCEKNISVFCGDNYRLIPKRV